jgi:hypothetical protein
MKNGLEGAATGPGKIVPELRRLRTASPISIWKGKRSE